MKACGVRPISSWPLPSPPRLPIFKFVSKVGGRSFHSRRGVHGRQFQSESSSKCFLPTVTEAQPHQNECTEHASGIFSWNGSESAVSSSHSRARFAGVNLPVQARKWHPRCSFHIRHRRHWQFCEWCRLQHSGRVSGKRFRRGSSVAGHSPVLTGRVRRPDWVQQGGTNATALRDRK